MKCTQKTYPELKVIATMKKGFILEGTYKETIYRVKDIY